MRIAGLSPEMLPVRKGALLRHHPNEAEFEGYSGLHQWNFDLKHGACVVWRPGERFDLGRHFRTATSSVHGTTDTTGRGLVSMVLRKTS